MQRPSPEPCWLLYLHCCPGWPRGRTWGWDPWGTFCDPLLCAGHCVSAKGAQDRDGSLCFGRVG